jgi:hypothetical protein
MIVWINGPSFIAFDYPSDSQELINQTLLLAYHALIYGDQAYFWSSRTLSFIRPRLYCRVVKVFHLQGQSATGR